MKQGLMTRFTAVLTLALGVSSSYAAPLGRLRLEKDRGVYRLYIRGRKTPLTTEIGTYPPHLDIHRNRSGLIYGTCTSVDSGAYLRTTSAAFLQLGRRFIQVPGYAVIGQHGRTALLNEVQTGIWGGGLEAKWFDGQKLIDIGPSDASYMPEPGIVRGYYYVDETGEPADGLLFSEITTPIFRQYFEWKAGVKTLKGKK
jgi:hypothetical protein